jgi:hypothetical protein
MVSGASFINTPSPPPRLFGLKVYRHILQIDMVLLPYWKRGMVESFDVKG